MCPACIATTAVMVAGAGSTVGILAVCIGKFRRFFGSGSVSNETDPLPVSASSFATGGAGLNNL